MRDGDQRARPRVQDVLHRREHVDVQVVRRLVEHEDVRLGQQHQQQVQPPPLATGQVGDPGRQVLAGEPETFQQLRRGELPAVDDERRPGPVEHLAHPVAGDRRELGELLVEHTDPDGLAGLHHPGVGRDGPGDQTEQGRLAGSVRAEDAGALAGTDPPFHVAQDGAAVEGDGRVQQVDHVLAQPGGREAGKLHPVTRRRDVGDERVRGLDAELRLRRARRGAAAQPGQLLAHQVLPLRLAGGGLPVALDALQHVGGIAALERLDDLVVHLPRHGADLVEEPAIVRDHQQTAGVAGPAPLEVVGEPGDALDVEMVGRLVQKDDVPLVQQQGGERDPAALPTGELSGPGLPGDVDDQPRDDVAHPGVTGPLVLRAVADDRLADGARVIERVGLVEHPHPDAAAAGHPPRVRRHLAREQAEQAGLSTTVASHQPDPVALVHAERHRVEDDPRRVLQVQGFRSKKMGHPFTLWSGRFGRGAPEPA